MRELLALIGEGDSALGLEAMFSLAQRLERSGIGVGAAAIYSALAQVCSTSEMSGSRALGDRSRVRLEILRGEGEGPARFEAMLRRGIDQATDPAMILGFGVAGGIASLAHSFALARFATLPSGLLTRGLGARALAGLVAYSVEVPSFVAVTQGYRGLREEVSWSELPRELGGAALFLGALKFTGFVGRELPLRNSFSPWVHRAATGLGIYLGQRLEEAAGLRPVATGIWRWADLVSTWFQLHVGGTMAHHLLAPPVASGMAASLLRLSNIPEAERFTRLPQLEGVEALLRHQAAAEVDEGDDSPTIPNFRVEPTPQTRLQSSLGERATAKVLDRSREIGETMEQPELFQRLLASTRLEDAPALELALLRLRHSVQHARDDGFGGNYVDCITRFALGKILKTGDSRSLDALLRLLHEGPILGDYEQWAGSLFEGYRLVPQGLLRQIRPIPGYLISRNPVHRRIRSLPISLYGRDLLHRFADQQGDLTEYQIERLEEALRPSAGVRDLFERVLTLARPNPLSYLRVWRMIGLAQSYSNQLPRLQELASPRWALRPAIHLLRHSADAAELTNTAEDAFMNDADLSGLLGEFYERLPQYLDPAQRHERQLRTRQSLAEIWSRERDFNRTALQRSLRALGDPVAIAVADNLENNRLDFFLLGSEEMGRVAERFYPEEGAADIPKGLFVTAQEGLPRDTIYLQSLREFTDPNRVLDRLATLVHEHEHYLRQPQRPRTTASARVEEMIAVLRSLQWRAEHGETYALEELLAESPVGFAMSLRALIERWYLVAPKNRR